MCTVAETIGAVTHTTVWDISHGNVSLATHQLIVYVRDWSKSIGGGGGGPEHLEIRLIKNT